MEISLSKESILVNKGGTTSAIAVNVTCEGEWKFTVSSTGSGWCTVKRPVNTNRLNITVSPNTDSNGKARSTTISVFSTTDTNVRKSITVKQAGPKDGLVVEDTYFSLTPKDSLLAVEILADADFDVELDEEAQDWVEYDGNESSGSGEEILNFIIAKNPSKTTRKGTATITSESNEKVKLTFAQAAGGIIASKSIFEAPSKNNARFSVELEVYAEIDDIIIEDGKEWAQYVECVTDKNDPYKRTLIFSLEKNPEKMERKVNITVVSELGDKIVFVIAQHGKDSVANTEAIGNDVIVPVSTITSTASDSYGGTVP